MGALGAGLLILVSACGGRVGSQQSGGPSGQAGQTGSGGSSSTDPPGCCGPPIVTCFAAGTPIDTPLGPRPIEQLAVGQEVLGYDEALQAVVARPVTARMRHDDAIVGQLVLDDGRTIVATPNHPFYVQSARDYRPAGELTSGADLLSLQDTGLLSGATATGYFLDPAPVHAPVFNITVEGVHNYFAAGVLVHNKSPLDPCEGLTSEPSDLVALTSWEHARSILELTGVASEPMPRSNTAPYHGLELPAGPAYRAPQLQSIAAAARAAASGVSDLVPCEGDPSSPGPEPCALAFIETRFLPYVYRRPLSGPERSRYLQLFRAAFAGGTFSEAMATLAEAALQSPHFLYKVELTQQGLSDYELATRLSYFLNGAPPDVELLANAGSGSLRQGLDAEVQRLSAKPHFPGAVRELYGAWLGLDRVQGAQVSPSELVQAMRGETEAFFDWHVSSGAAFSSLLTEPITFADQLMADHYGLSPRPGLDRARFELDPTRYAGALTQASFMSTFSTPTRRGAWILARLLCSEPPPPPADVMFPTPPAPGEDWRQWLEAATADPVCHSCHQIMDPVGFAFQSFDELGRWRAADDSGGLPRVGVAVPVKGAAELVKAVLSTRDVVECALRHWTAWALKRAPDERVGCEIRQAAVSGLSDQMTTRELLGAIAQSEIFQSGQSDALSIEEPDAPGEPIPPLTTEAARHQAARELVLQELSGLRQRLPNDLSLAIHQNELEALAIP